MSAQDFLKSKGSPSSPSPAPKGLISAKDFMIQKEQPTTDAYLQGEKTFGAPNLNPSFPTQPTYPTSAQGPVPIQPIQQAKSPTLLSKLTNNPIVNRVKQQLGTIYNAEIAKPASSLEAIVADLVGKLNNTFEKHALGLNGADITPSQTRSLSSDLSNIWKQQGGGGDIAHNAMVGAAPNDFLKNLPGTNFSLGNIEE